MTARKNGVKYPKTGIRDPKPGTKPPETAEFDWPQWTRAATSRAELVRLALVANQRHEVIAKHFGFTPNAVYYYKRLIQNPPATKKKRPRRRSDTQKRIFARRNLVRVLARKTLKAVGDPEETHVAKSVPSSPCSRH
jgi:hypothetical protein